MFKKVLFALIATALVAGFTLPLPTSAEAATVTCRAAAKAKFPNDLKARHAYFKQCKKAWKAAQKKS
ncbi:MAG TPA: hypothetical protein VNJ31_05770 [Methyloceanibacter sp.]|nr:hypothetical protein [Methyloceanibacter sp.]